MTSLNHLHHCVEPPVYYYFYFVLFLFLFFCSCFCCCWCCCCCCFFWGGGISRASQVYANKLLVCEEWACDRNSTPLPLVDRELKQQPRRRLRKCQLKSVFVLLKTLLRLFHLVLFIRSWRIFLVIFTVLSLCNLT